ncbi:hypothetical protein CFSAN001627_03805 [Clostridium botulinum CFSAN001627]|uniref:Lipoprotein n=1 Tax=Clostridium botulinum CFSAN001627 TaxID=1232189 RepID=M1ZSZ1_CLOBO|nr:hypothetical protein CFSAN001627_03805 [Clostridium botulinum CFSAN001627]
MRKARLLIIGLLIGACTRFIGIARVVEAARIIALAMKNICIAQTMVNLYGSLYMMSMKKKNFFIYDNQIQIKLLN